MVKQFAQLGQTIQSVRSAGQHPETCIETILTEKHGVVVVSGSIDKSRMTAFHMIKVMAKSRA